VLARHADILVSGQYGQTMSLDFAELVTELAMPMITKPLDLEKLLTAVKAAARPRRKCRAIVPCLACQSTLSPVRFWRALC
jgi:hypothetical protein